MKKISNWLAFACALIFFVSCGKKYTCTQNIHYFSVSIIYKGFTSSDLSKVLVQTYNPNGSFNNVLSSDTMDFSNADFSNDTAYRKNDFDKSGLYILTSGKDYKLTVLSTNQSYKISNIHQGNASQTWTQDTQCPLGASQDELASDLFDLNAQPAAIFSFSPTKYVVCLSH